MARDLTFGFTATAVGEPGLDDRALYAEIIADCKTGQALGYDSAWMLEHHFSDYFPTPSPLLTMAHAAAHCPGLGFGSAVLVAPWYNPVRLVSEIAMLSNLCTGELHLGLGRGTAKMEYDAFDIDMAEARDRYRECFDVLRLGVSGAPFTYDGEYVRLRREVRVRPTPASERINFYGAIGSPQSAPVTAAMGLAPLCSCQFPFHVLEKILAGWAEGADANVGPPPAPRRPVFAHCLMADSDDEALALARHHLSAFFALQARHYEADLDAWADIKGYEQFSRFFANLSKLAEPAAIDKFASHNLIGTPATVAERVERLVALGFDYIIVHAATIGVPRATRHDALRRFATSVAPEFSSAFHAAAVAE